MPDEEPPTEKFAAEMVGGNGLQRLIRAVPMVEDGGGGGKVVIGGRSGDFWRREAS